VSRLDEFLPFERLFSFGSLLKFVLLFSTVKVTYLFCHKMGLATFWAIFKKTHLVTLIDSHMCKTQYVCKRTPIAEKKCSPKVFLFLPEVVRFPKNVLRICCNFFDIFFSFFSFFWCRRILGNGRTQRRTGSLGQTGTAVPQQGAGADFMNQYRQKITAKNSQLPRV
jgi:hypothetical protein